MTQNPLPSYDNLTRFPDTRTPSSWGLWGEDDVFGSLNLLTRERAVAGADEVKSGTVLPLNWALELPDPPLSGRPVFEHTVTPVAGGLGNDDEYSNFNPQASSQLDGFAHVRHPRFGYYNNHPLQGHGMHHWARRGIAGRAVLADVARWREGEGRPLRHGETDPITVSDLHSTLESQKVSFEAGDILLVRTGFVSWYESLSAAERNAFSVDLKMPGLAQGDDMAEAIWNLHPSVVAADNMALEVWPPVAEIDKLMDNPEAAESRFLHVALIPLFGIPVGELWDLEGLAAHCAQDGRYAAQLTMAPMNKTGGIASMANAVAIK